MVDYVKVSSPGDGFEQQFSYHEIRYLQIYPLSSAPRLADITGLRLFTSRARVGSFDSSDDTINAIYDTFVRTYEGLTLSGYTVRFTVLPAIALIPTPRCCPGRLSAP